MSTLTSITSLPASRSPRRGHSGLSDAGRADLSLFWLELRRSQGYWLLPVMVAIALYTRPYQAYESDSGVVLWPMLSAAIAQSHLAIGALTAALGAWLAAREGRRKVTGLIESVPALPSRRDLVTMQVASLWGMGGYAIVCGWLAWKGYTEATWGGPDIPLIASGALAIVVFATLGVLVGRLLPGKFTPILAFGLPILIVIALDQVKIKTTVTNEYGTFEERRQVLELLTPWGFSETFSDVFVRPHALYIDDALIWLAGLAGVVTALLVLRKQRTVVGWIALAGSLTIAGLGAIPLVGQDLDSPETRERTAVPFAWSCQVASGIETCVHPAYEARLDDVATRQGAFLEPLAGLDGIPARVEQASPIQEAGSDVAQLWGLDRRALAHSAIDLAFPGSNEWGPEGPRPASQIVILRWLQGESGISSVGIDVFGWPLEAQAHAARAEPDPANPGVYVEFPPEPDEAALAAFEPRIDAAVERFTALSPEQQQAWQEANWDALRAGDLTLEDLP